MLIFFKKLQKVGEDKRNKVVKNDLKGMVCHRAQLSSPLNGKERRREKAGESDP